MTVRIIYIPLLPGEAIALYISNEARPSPPNATRWYLQVLDDGAGVLVGLGLAAKVTSDGL